MPDMSHAAMQAAFDVALAVPRYPSGGVHGPRWQFFVDNDLQTIFEEDDALGAEQLLPRWAHLMRNRGLGEGWDAIPEGTVILAHWEGTASLLHWGKKLQLVTVVPGSDGPPQWRRVRTEPSFILDPRRGYQAIRIRGLPAEMQAAQYAAEQRLTKLHATLDLKARRKADDEIQHIVRCMVRDGPDIVMGTLYLIRDRLPEICHDRTVSAVAPMISDAHHRHAMSRRELKNWRKDLSNTSIILRGRVEHPPVTRGGGPGVLRELDLGSPSPVAPAMLPGGYVARAIAIPAEVHADIPAEDADALSGL